MSIKQKKSDSNRDKQLSERKTVEKSVLTMQEAREQLAKLSRTAKVGDLLSSYTEEWNMGPDSINHKG